MEPLVTYYLSYSPRFHAEAGHLGGRVMNSGVGLTFGLGPHLPFPSCVTLGLTLYFLSSLRDITDVQEIANDGVVLTQCEIQSTGPK